VPFPFLGLLIGVESTKKMITFWIFYKTLIKLCVLIYLPVFSFTSLGLGLGLALSGVIISKSVRDY